MRKESLIMFQEKIVEIFEDININTYDKIELLINLNHFLDPETYEENIKVLKKARYSSKID